MTPEKLDEKLSKMPAFVREYVAQLRERIAEYEERDARQAAAKTRIGVLAHYDAPKQWLPDDSQIIFTLSVGTEITVKLVDGLLNIHANGFGHTVIAPHASNTFDVTVLSHEVFRPTKKKKKG